jgi:glyoxylase-like metal-dependent hydrolase (beta-lactamase superfamily II)
MFFPNLKGSRKQGKEIIKNVYYFDENQILDCNQYLIIDSDTNNISLFDAGNGLSLNGLIKGMEELGLDYKRITNIFLTHEHVDHVLGLYPLMELLKDNPPKIYAHSETKAILESGNIEKIIPGNLGIKPNMFGVNIVPLDVIELKEETYIEVGVNFNFKIYYTPGHSIGSISYYDPDHKILIPGDLIFTGGSFGRYDFPGGSLKILTQSIKTMNKLDVKYLLPGHMGVSNNGKQDIALSYRMIQSINNFY